MISDRWISEEGGKRGQPPFTGLLVAFVLRQFVIRHSPRGVTLIEVLFSIGILLFGLWFVAAMIPLGKLALVATEKSDRTGACGRAALHEVKVREFWSTRHPGFHRTRMFNTRSSRLGSQTAMPTGAHRQEHRVRRTPHGKPTGRQQVTVA